jgi:PRC-barrel domain
MTDTSSTSTPSGPVRVENVGDWRGKDVVDAGGDKLGKFEELYYDGETDAPAFVAVKSGLIGKHLTLVPVSGASVTPDALRVGFAKSQVKDAPSYDPETELSTDDEAGAYAYYSLPYSPAGDGARRLAKR